MQQARFIKLVSMTLLLSTTIVSCRRDTNIDINSPSYIISQSEKLVIPANVELPGNLPNGNTRVATYYAEGVQKYKAQPKPGSDPVTYVWALVAPDANLFDASNRKVGTHTVGPSWQLTSTADSIFAQHFTPAKTVPSTDPRSVDWLLLAPKTGKTPTGFFKDVAYIQRIATHGGKAPVTLPTTITDTIDVKYTAVYRLSKKNS